MISDEQFIALLELCLAECKNLAQIVDDMSAYLAEVHGK